MEQQTVEQPFYTIKQSINRAIIPKIITLFVLGTIFYLGILLNLSLLQLNTNKIIIQYASLALIIFIVIIGIILSFKKAKQNYLFYRNGIKQGRKIVRYLEIISTEPKQNMFDKMFKTYHINLNKKSSFHHISEEIQLQSYLQQLIQYSKKS